MIPLDISNDPARLQQIFQNYQNFKPYPQFGNITIIQTTATIRITEAHGESRSGIPRASAMNAFYTYSKTLNDADDDGGANGVTYYNRRLEKARASYDIQHRLVGCLYLGPPVRQGPAVDERRRLEGLVPWRLGWRVDANIPVRFSRQRYICRQPL